MEDDAGMIPEEEEAATTMNELYSIALVAGMEVGN
jgi:hypothetical protein